MLSFYYISVTIRKEEKTMLQFTTSIPTRFESFEDQQSIDQLIFLNNNFPTKSLYPVRLLRIQQKRYIESSYRVHGRKWHICPGCLHPFSEDLNDHCYTFRPDHLNLTSSFFQFEYDEFRKVIHCCSKGCLTASATIFARDSLTAKGRKYIAPNKINRDIQDIVRTFHWSKKTGRKYREVFYQQWSY